jgi:hypothetical protein
VRQHAVAGVEVGGGTVLTLTAAVPDLAVRWMVLTSDPIRRREAEAFYGRKVVLAPGAAAPGTRR